MSIVFAVFAVTTENVRCDRMAASFAFLVILRKARTRGLKALVVT